MDLETLASLRTVLMLGGILGICMLVLHQNVGTWRNPFACIVGGFAFTVVLNQGLVLYFPNDWFLKTLMGVACALFIGLLLYLGRTRDHFASFEERMAAGVPFDPEQAANEQFEFETTLPKEDLE